MPLMPWAASPSAMARTSRGCILVKSATWSKVRAVLSTSHTAVALGISGALLMANLLCASPTSFWEAKSAVIGDDGNSGPIYALRGHWRNGLLKCLDSAQKQPQVLIRIGRSPPTGEG